MSDETQKATRPDATSIKNWKKQHGGLYQFTVEGKIMIMREPKMKDLERAMAADPKNKKPFNFHRSIISNCKLYADDGLLEDDDAYLALCGQIDEVVDVKEVEVKKL